MERIVTDFNIFTISMVSDPEPGMEIRPDPIFMQANKMTHHGRIYGRVVSDAEDLIDKYDRTMKLLEMYINE